MKLRAFAFSSLLLLVPALSVATAEAGPVRRPQSPGTTTATATGLEIEQLSACSATIFGVFGSSGRTSDTQAWLGTAFPIGVEGDTLVMITNRHCLGIDELIATGGGGGFIGEYGLLIEFPTGKLVPVASCAFFRDLDLAILMLPSRGLTEGEDYFLVPMYEGSDLSVGDEVAASGSPSDESGYYQGTVTFGRISAFRELGGVPVIQLDAAINHGNSGGPLLLEQDGLFYCIGVNTWGTEDETIEGIGFAIDLSRAGEIIDLNNLVTYRADITGLREAIADMGYGSGATQGRGVRVDGTEPDGRGHRVGSSGSSTGTGRRVR